MQPDQLYGYPKTRFVADFIGTCNLLVGPVVESGSGVITVMVPDLGAVKVATPGTPAMRADAAVALRPEKVRLSAPGSATPADNSFAGTVRRLSLPGRRDGLQGARGARARASKRCSPIPGPALPSSSKSAMRSK